MKDYSFSCKHFKLIFCTLIVFGYNANVFAESIETNSHHLHTTESISPNKSITWSDDKKLHFKGITITPGGFLAGEGLWRSRNEQSDIGSTFSGIPLGNNPLHNMHEFRLSARQSRASILIEGWVNPCILLSGYYEIDFLGTGTANSTESNSFDARIRHMYATVDRNDWGFHFLAGQTWSLATTNNKGITPRNEPIPPTIDSQYVVGFIWKRQAQYRFTMNFNDSFWAALSIENPQTVFGGTPCGTVLPGISNEICRTPGNQSLPSTSLFSINHVPDVIAKLAYDHTICNHHVHLEGFGLYRSFYNRVEYTNGHNKNHEASGYGVGGGAVIEVLPEKLDLQGDVMGGRGIGSYASGVLPDVTLAQNGSLTAIPEFLFMAGLTLHTSPLLDVYLFGGEEKESRKYFQANNKFFGYGLPTADNLGCNIENGICTGDTEELSEITVGFWDKLYKGSYGDFRIGLQYAYVERELFSGTGGLPLVPPPHRVGSSTNDHMVLFSARYYPFT